MRSGDILFQFPPIELEKPLAYLRDLPYNSIYEVIVKFSNLSEEEMANFSFPEKVSKIKKEYLDSRYGKDSYGYKDFNTAVLAIIFIKACAQINRAIYALRDKYAAQEAKYPRGFSSYESIPFPIWYKSTDEDVLKIKNAAIKTKDGINNYAKKYTLDGFEENFINTFKYQVFYICERFDIETRTFTQQATDAGENILIHVVGFILFVAVFFLMVKCACG